MSKNFLLNSFDTLWGHIKKHYGILIVVGIFCIVGIVIGIALIFGEKSYLNLLTTKNQNMLGYISGNISIFKLFFNKLFLSLSSITILFCFCLNYYSSFLSLIYFAFQSAICTLMCGTLIKYQGFAAIINTVLLIIPTNIILLGILAVAFSVFFVRAKAQNKYKTKLSNSFGYNNFSMLSIMCIIGVILLNILVSLIVPLILRGVCLVYY